MTTNIMTRALNLKIEAIVDNGGINTEPYHIETVNTSIADALATHGRFAEWDIIGDMIAGASELPEDAEAQTASDYRLVLDIYSTDTDELILRQVAELNDDYTIAREYTEIDNTEELARELADEQ